MLYKLSRNTFLRDYGPYTYIQNIRSGADVMFKDATCFFRWLTRTPIDKDEILCKLSSEHDISAAEVENDLDSLLDPLIVQGWVLAGDDEGG